LVGDVGREKIAKGKLMKWRRMLDKFCTMTVIVVWESKLDIKLQDYLYKLAW